MIDELTKDWPHAIVVLTAKDRDSEYRRPAAFAFDAKDGFAWVEPQYIDPYGASSPALHIVEATLQQRGIEILFDGPEWSGYIAPYTDETDLVGNSLERYKEWLREQGKTAAEERNVVRRMIAADLDGRTD